MNERVLARAYAKVAFNCAKSMNAIEAWSKVFEQMAALLRIPLVRRFVLNPRVSEEDKVKTLLGEHYQETQKDFLYWLAYRHHWLALLGVADVFKRYAEREQNSLTVEVSAACMLSEIQKDQIQNNLKRRYPQALKIIWVVDQAQLGGLKFRVKDQVWDASIQNKCLRLRDKVEG